ncbi:MAG: peptide chain release factor N(5)-glutamine methyltransferase [Acidimicrobiia bacterium]|nr:peptide chain release factor N(5)-glutamine methyltransferase [Acidimicrobiia bacterium]MBA3802735.1 peptide chain release factor N(5)-glutamine methyltransferase [Acidimicrobiia bacterium]
MLRPAPTWRALLAWTTQRVEDRQVAHWMCEHASGRTSSELDASLDEPSHGHAAGQLASMVDRYADGEPLQYVLGAWGFRSLDLAVDGRALIPRPETELLVDVCLELLSDRLPTRDVDPLTIVDLGTGTGAIGLALASELPIDGVTVWLSDVSAEALALATANLSGIGRHARNVRVAPAGSWFEPFDAAAQFDLVVANPPYVPRRDPALEPIVRKWEPHVALYGGADGLDHFRSIVAAAPARLRPGGRLVMEIGSGQGERVRALMLDAGLASPEVRLDLGGHERIALAELT